jgi:hypothetical protein
MKDPEFFRRYFYKVAVVRQEFYKGAFFATPAKLALMT